MKPKGNWNCSINCVHFGTSYYTNSQQQPLWHNKPFSWPPVWYAHSRWCFYHVYQINYLLRNKFTTFPGTAAIKCVVFWDNMKNNARKFCDHLAIFDCIMCMAVHRDLRLLMSFHTYFYEIWTLRRILSAERSWLEGKIITTVWRKLNTSVKQFIWSAQTIAFMFRLKNTCLKPLQRKRYAATEVTE